VEYDFLRERIPTGHLNSLWSRLSRKKRSRLPVIRCNPHCLRFSSSHVIHIIETPFSYPVSATTMSVAIVHINISPELGGTLLAISAGLSTIWVILCAILALFDAKTLRQRAHRANQTIQLRNHLPSVRTNNLSGFLAVASALTFTATDYPEPQTLSSFLVIILAICSALRWIDMEHPDEILGKGVDVLTIVVTAVLVMDKANKTYDWQWYHDPSLYCMIALSLEGWGIAMGLWAVFARWNEPKLKVVRQHAMSKSSSKKPVQSLLCVVFGVCIASLVLCVRAMLGSEEPYTIGFGVVLSTLFACAGLSLIILQQTRIVWSMATSHVAAQSSQSASCQSISSYNASGPEMEPPILRYPPVTHRANG
jgi:hypothetical protein